MIQLDKKRVVLTGAGGGLGTRLVAAFRAAGAEVVVCDRAGACMPADLESHHFDLSDPAAVASGADAILANGSPDIFVSNAGVTTAEVLDDLTPDRLASELAANFTGAADLSARLVPGMCERGGAMVFVASVNGLSHYGNPAYSAAKAALLGWMRAIATEKGRFGLRANAVCPGSIRTPVWDARIAADPRVLENVAKLYPLGRFVTPDEVANAVLFLASPLASGITGVTMPVDAGLSGGNLPFIDAIT
ncbi:SDR family oxidoreductase [Pseudoruegeria sp. SK021]|uniref:SDR family oxidoreductase n=1 Tax=Pseudoruegeria sp. SK021 TaxID=1933035 RepID=UPI000A223972|nr:SDR family oxidoreductase [Pseudoruegeria sp. SK021]OSP55808.1 SDR family oxidoreductase [Pseudoruegeria sp. SK021]